MTRINNDEQARLRSEWHEALTRTLKSPTFEEWLKAKQTAKPEDEGMRVWG